MASPAAVPSDTVRTFDPARVTHPLVKPLARLMPELSYYTLVSAAALIVDLIIYNALVGGGTRAALAGIFGYGVGLILHYALSVRFVFTASRGTKAGFRRFVEFAVSGLIGLAITWLIIAAATEVLHLPAMIGKIAAVGVSFVIVFILRKSIVFADRSRAK